MIKASVAPMLSSSIEKMTKTELLSVIHDLNTVAESARAESEEIRELTYQLQVHQEELRMQNEELRNTTRMLEDSRQEYARLFDYAPMGYLTLDEHGIIHSVNLAGAVMVGVTDRMVLYGTPFPSYLGANDQPVFLTFLRKVMLSEEPQSIELTLSFRGKKTCVQLNCRSIFVAKDEATARMCWCSMTDISSRKEMEGELRASRANLEAVFENTRDALWSVDKNGKVVTSNSAFRSLKERMVSCALFEKKLAECYRRALNRERFGMEDVIRITPVPGSEPIERYVELSFNPIVHYGIVDGVACAARDITERRKIEEELVRAKEIAEGQAHMKSKFLSSMSHELRTPLMAIIANCNVVEEIAAGSPDVKYYTTIIEENSKRLIEIINDILDLSRLESRRSDFGGTIIDPVANVETIVKSLEPVAKKKSVTLGLGTSRTRPRIFVNPGYLDRILTNLMGNAIKFTNNGTILVSVVEEGSPEDRHVAICVVDTGVGISESFLPYIFDEFRRERNALETEGTGLGLAITKKLVESMNGAIEIRSSEGKGTTVVVRFPKVADDGRVN